MNTRLHYNLLEQQPRILQENDFMNQQAEQPKAEFIPDFLTVTQFLPKIQLDEEKAEEIVESASGFSFKNSKNVAKIAAGLGFPLIVAAAVWLFK